jgi:hypothetical protein
MPGGHELDPAVCDGRGSVAAVDATGSKQQRSIVCVACADQLGPTPAAEPPALSRRRLIVSEELLADPPAEARPLDGHDGGEGRPVRFSAHLAVAICAGSRNLFDTVTDSAAQAASLDHGVISSRRTSGTTPCRPVRQARPQTRACTPCIPTLRRRQRFNPSRLTCPP